MARPAVDSQLNTNVRSRAVRWSEATDEPAREDARPTGRVEFRLATATDDPAIRRLLRENATRGEITLSFEREPDYFRGAAAGADDPTIVVFERGRLICMGHCSVRRRFVNGEIRRVGYLADLRLDAAAQGRFDILRRGYRFFHELHRDNPPDLYFTSIAADNARSIRFLERGLPGMPAYERLADFVTMLVPVPRGTVTLRRRAASARQRLEANGCQAISGADRSVAELVECLNAHAAKHQLARAWTECDLHALRNPGLAPADFRLVRRGSEPIACAALWDQRGFKQTVVRGYSPKLAWSRSSINFAAALFGTPGLPPPGSTLAHGLLSPLAVDAQNDLLPALVEWGLCEAAQRGLDFITVGFAAGDPRLARLRSQFRGREYLSRLYRVSWPGAKPERFDDRPVFPEVALL